jgi:DNA-binding SARP family transcriptional activator
MNFTDLIDLASEKVGGAVIYANDDFFAPKENLLKASEPIFIEGKYTDRGKWMDGWESRRRRTPGFDWCIIRLGLPGIVRGVVVDTSFFRGNYPEHCSLDGASFARLPSEQELLDESVQWRPLLPQSPLAGDSRNAFPIEYGERITHLRFRIFPDGGIARLRVFGEVVPDWERIQRAGTSVVGGPGLGKTTLLAQAIAENRLAPRGTDVWIGLERQDEEADRLARVVAAAISGRPVNGKQLGPAGATAAALAVPAAAPESTAPSVAGRIDEALPAPDPAAVADAVWQRSPAETCLVLDDVHLLPATSTGAAWLTDLLHMLPANGHIVFASRSEPPVPLGRYHALGTVLSLAEEELRFDDDELADYATARGLDPHHFSGTGGWPAMAALTASVERNVTGTYLWEEVLEPLGTLRRHVLAVLCDLGGADDELASAAVGSPVDLDRDLDGVPLVARDADGWHVPHALWRTAPRLTLGPTETAEIRIRAIRNLTERGRFDAAFNLVETAGLWDEAPTVLRAACLAGERPARQLGRWLAASPEAVRTSSAGRLAAGLYAASSTPEHAVAPLKAAAALLQADDDPDAELVAIAHIGRMAWWWQDLRILADLSPRVYELHLAGHAKATALVALGWALASDIAGNDRQVLEHLDNVPPGALDPTNELLSGWFRGAVRLYRGEVRAAAEIAAEIGPIADPSMRYIADTLDLMVKWAQGRIDEVLERMPGVVAAARVSGVAYTLSLGVHTASIGYSHVGNVAVARELLEEAKAAAPTPDHGKPSVHTAMATASLQLAEGDERAAVATLRDAAAHHGFDNGVDRRWWRQMISLTYVLLPESRAHWDKTKLRGPLITARDLAAAVVVCRNGTAGQAEQHLRKLALPELNQVRAALHHRHAAELAVGLAAAGRQEGRRLLDLLGPPGREALRALTEPSPTSPTALTPTSPAAAEARPAGKARSPQARQAKQAKSLLAAVPAPPPHVTYLGMLGPLTVRRGDSLSQPIDDADLRRQRVQELLAFLVGHRRTTRAAVTSALWPDLDERSAGNNLGVNLNRLLRLLEPWRQSGEPAFYVRLEGAGMQLVTGEHLRIDVDEFDEHLALASRAEHDGAPSLALDHDLAAVALYRDQLHVDLPEAEWFALDRVHYRTKFVRAAVRAGQLLIGHGDIDRAHGVAQRALQADPWAEDAYGVLVAAALARGDRSAARRLLDHCLATLSELGAAPSPATQQLRRRVEQPT